MTDASQTRQAALLAHLESSYAYAQLLTGTPKGAMLLVEGAYRIAIDRLEEAPPPPADEAWLLQLIHVLHEERRLNRASPTSDDPEHAPSTTRAAALPRRHRLLQEVLDRALPLAFASLTREQQQLLMLLDVTRLRIDEVASVLGTPLPATSAAGHRARASLRALLYANASAVEQQLLDAHLTDENLRSGLRRVLANELAPLPTALRPALEALPQATRPADPPPRLPVQAREQDTQRRRSRLRPILFAAFFIFVALLISNLLFKLIEPEPPITDVIALTVAQAETVRPSFHPGGAEQAESYLLDRLGWRLTIPEIEGASLEGVGTRAIVEDVEVPVLRYDDPTTGTPVIVYVFTYALLDRHPERLRLATDILRHIERAENYDLHDLGRHKVLIWRHRNDIFVAVTEGDASALRSRIVFPS